MSDQNVETKPLHKGTAVSCVLSAIVHSLFFMLLLPNFPFIIRGFKDDVRIFPSSHLQIPLSKVSTYTALMITLYYIGSTIGCVLWGAVADKIGRKPTVIITLVCTQ